MKTNKNLGTRQTLTLMHFSPKITNTAQSLNFLFVRWKRQKLRENVSETPSNEVS